MPQVKSQMLKVEGSQQRGQALIMVILIGLLALGAVVSATTLVVSELRKNIETNSGIVEYEITYGALENALLRLLRDPSYANETVTLDSATCYITVSSGASQTVEARCTNGNYVRKLNATVMFFNGIMTVSNVSEVP